MLQVVRIYSKTGREAAINQMISDGWKVVSISQSNKPAFTRDQLEGSLVIVVLFEKES